MVNPSTFTIGMKIIECFLSKSMYIEAYFGAVFLEVLRCTYACKNLSIVVVTIEIVVSSLLW